MNDYEAERRKRRIHVTFSIEQKRLIEIGVESGMALNEAEYIRRAVDELNRNIPLYKKLQKIMSMDSNVEDEIDKLLNE